MCEVEKNFFKNCATATIALQLPNNRIYNVYTGLPKSFEILY